MPNRRHYPRSARVNELVREIVAEVLESFADDERLELLTITGVDADQDLRHATVFFTSRHAGGLAALEEHRTRLQAEINRQARFRRTPQLRFVEDPGISAGWKVESILRDLSNGDLAEGRDEGHEPGG